MGGTGASGSIFEIAAGSSTLTSLASFDSTTGDVPSSGLVMDNSGNLYGTTPRHGANGYGAIYELTAGSSSVTVLAPFTSSNAPLQASAPTLDAQGDLFGTTQFGGTYGDGSVYELPSGSASINTLASFTTTDGAYPSSSLLIDASGNLFGTTPAGGIGGDGTIFEVAASSNTISTLISFNGSNGNAGTDGFSHNAVMPDLVADSHGNFYGVAPSGGVNGLGVVYEMSPQKATQVVITQQPGSNATAGIPESISLSTETSGGFVDTTSNAPVTISIASGPPGATLTGTLTSSAVNGVASFTNIILKTAGAYTLIARSTGLTSATTASITVAAAAANKLTVIQQPVGTTAGASIGNIVLDVQDAFGNIVTSDSSTVTMSATNGAPANGATSQQAVAGVVTFAGLSFNKSGSYTLSASDAGIVSVNTSSFTIAAAAASQLILAQQPVASTVAGSPIGPLIVDVDDRFGNVVTTNATGLSVVASGNASIVGNKSKTATSGVANFSGLSINTAGSYTFTVTDGTLVPVTTSSFLVTAGIASKLVVVQQPPGSASAGQSFGPVTVNVEDSFGNLVSANASKISVAASGNVPIIGTASIQASGGVATFASLAIDKVGTYTLLVSTTGLLAANSSSIAVTNGTASQLVISQQPSASTAAGQIISGLSATVEDAFGNIATTDASTITVAVSNGTALAGIVSKAAAKGSAVFSDLIMTMAGSYTMTLTDGSFTPVVSNTFKITAGAAAQLAITQQPTNATVNQPMGTLSIAVEDAFGNLVSGDHSSITITAAAQDTTNTTYALTGTTMLPVQAGVANFSTLEINTAGTYTLTASDAALGPAISGNVTVAALPSPPTPTPPTPAPNPTKTFSVIAGDRMTGVVIDTSSAFANPTLLTRAVHVRIVSTASGLTVLNQAVRLLNFKASLVRWRIRKSGNYSVICTDAAGNKVTDELTVFAATAIRMKFATEPVVLNGISPLVISAVDRFGNLANSTDGQSVALGIGWRPHLGKAPTLAGTPVETFSGGVATFSNLLLDRPARLVAINSSLALVESGLFAGV